MNYEEWKQRQAEEEAQYRHAARVESERASAGLAGPTAPPPDSIAALVAQHTEQINGLMGQVEVLRMELMELRKRTEPESVDRMLAQRLTIGRTPRGY